MKHKSDELIVERLTALWAFVELGLGGILHGIRLPFSGLFLASIAIVLITLISKYSNFNYKTIIKCTLIVISIKAIASPHTPPTAYFAVAFQASLAAFVYSLFKTNFVTIAFVSVIALLESALQKILLLTILFGNELWLAIDTFLIKITNQFSFLGAWVDETPVITLAFVYLSLYILAGLIAASMAFMISKDLPKAIHEIKLQTVPLNQSELNQKKKSRSKKFVLFAALLLILSASYFLKSSPDMRIPISILRALILIYVWFAWISPWVSKWIRSKVENYEKSKGRDIAHTMDFIPNLRSITAAAYKASRGYGFMRSWYRFILYTIAGTINFDDNNKQIT